MNYASLSKTEYKMGTFCRHILTNLLSYSVTTCLTTTAITTKVLSSLPSNMPQYRFTSEAMATLTPTEAMQGMKFFATLFRLMKGRHNRNSSPASLYNPNILERHVVCRRDIELSWDPFTKEPTWWLSNDTGAAIRDVIWHSFVLFGEILQPEGWDVDRPFAFYTLFHPLEGLGIECIRAPPGITANGAFMHAYQSLEQLQAHVHDTQFWLLIMRQIVRLYAVHQRTQGWDKFPVVDFKECLAFAEATKHRDFILALADLAPPYTTLAPPPGLPTPVSMHAASETSSIASFIDKHESTPSLDFGLDTPEEHSLPSPPETASTEVESFPEWNPAVMEAIRTWRETQEPTFPDIEIGKHSASLPSHFCAHPFSTELEEVPEPAVVSHAIEVHAPSPTLPGPSVLDLQESCASWVFTHQGDRITTHACWIFDDAHWHHDSFLNTWTEIKEGDTYSKHFYCT